jgi:ketosteroid isomerase-like protein
MREGSRHILIRSTDRIAANLAAVENHFHSEASNEVEAALAMFTDDVVWEAPALNGLNRAYRGKAAAAEELPAALRVDAERSVPVPAALRDRGPRRRRQYRHVRGRRGRALAFPRRQQDRDAAPHLRGEADRLRAGAARARKHHAHRRHLREVATECRSNRRRHPRRRCMAEDATYRCAASSSK